MLGPTFVAMRARMPTQSVSVLNTVSARDTDVGGNSETESPATRGPLEAVRYGVPVNTLPCVFEKNTSKRTLPPPPVHMSAAAAVAVTESTDDFPNPGGRKNCRDTVESVWGIPPSTLNDFTESLAERKRSEEHTSELQSQSNLVCRLLLEKKKKKIKRVTPRVRARRRVPP